MGNAAPLLSRNPKLSPVEMDGRLVMMDSERGVYFALDAVGSAVWEILEEPSTLETVTRHVARSFDAPCREELRRDLEEFIAALIDQGLLLQGGTA
ncbi:PqqD family protein [Erythrobacter sp. SDW2]|uniref:PqqD family protein n=1 Tax=Erythrobacter sp. SDW2 TaxID=2907154 RepID=UPI001F479837|nr:PqqD family protein [Erythrobacter sp. SDW2]UIP06154.1 PqqD family protein [Erythrobacter sp. SDW2]